MEKYAASLAVLMLICMGCKSHNDVANQTSDQNVTVMVTSDTKHENHPLPPPVQPESVPIQLVPSGEPFQLQLINELAPLDLKITHKLVPQKLTVTHVHEPIKVQVPAIELKPLKVAKGQSIQLVASKEKGVCTGTPKKLRLPDNQTLLVIVGLVIAISIYLGSLRRELIFKITGEKAKKRDAIKSNAETSPDVFKEAKKTIKRCRKVCKQIAIADFGLVICAIALVIYLGASYLGFQPCDLLAWIGLASIAYAILWLSFLHLIEDCKSFNH